MMSAEEYKKNIFDLKDKSILFWIDQAAQVALIELLEFRTFPKGQFIHEKVRPDELAILIQGKANLISKESNAFKENVIPGRSFELNSCFEGGTRAYKWVAEDTTTIAVISFDILKGHLEKNGNMEYLRRISTVIELQKFKNDMRMLGVDSRTSKKIISSLVLNQAAPLPLELAVICTGGVAFVKDDQELKKIHISDYYLERESVVVAKTIEEGSSFWKLPANFGLKDQIDSSIYTFFDIITDFEKVAEDEVENQDNEEPQEIDDYEISHFNKTNPLPKEFRKLTRNAQRQHDQMDCGAACMSMISYAYNKKINISTWRRLIHVTKEGASMLSIKLAADKLGFETIGIMSGVNGLRSFTTPFIALMSYHYVVVYEIKENEVVIADPARGAITLKMDEFKKDYSSNVLLIRPSVRLLSYPDSPAPYKKYLSLFRPHFKDVAQITVFSSLLFLFSLVPPLFNQYVFDSVLGSGRTDKMKMLSLCAMAFCLSISLLSYLRLSFIVRIASIISLKLSALFFRQILRLPYNYFTVRNVGDITTRVDELEKIRAFFTSKSISIFLNILALGIYSSILLVYHPYFSYLTVGAIILIIVTMTPLFKKIKQQIQDVFYSMGKASSSTFEQFQSLRTIQNITGTMQARWRWEESQLDVQEKKNRIQTLNATTMSLGSLMQQSINLAFLGTAIALFLDHEITIGQVVAVTSISALIIGPIIELIQSLDDFSQIKVSFEKIDEIVTSKVEDESSTIEFPADFKTIKFQDVWFKYGSDFSPWILKGIDLEVHRGQKIAFVGPSGSGKSTISYMLNLIYTPQKGTVQFDGINNLDINLNSLRSKISMIVQDNSLLTGTVLSNIALGDPSPDLKRASEAAQLAEASDFIMGLPLGYNTQIGGEFGTNMSGGQKQRLCIARAIYGSPDVLIMDEATSALDTITEKKVMNNLYQKLKKTTCFIIAHRLNTIISADLIVVVKDGKIREIGNHDVLMKKQGIYYGMFKKQVNL